MTSPQDYALLCSYFVKTYPDILTHTSSPEIVVKEGTPYEEHFKSYQISLEGAKYGLKGTDGLKTGSSGRAGFNYSSTAKRQDTRLVEIVMGVSDGQTRPEKNFVILLGMQLWNRHLRNTSIERFCQKEHIRWKRENCNKERPVGLCAKRRKNKV